MIARYPTFVVELEGHTEAGAPSRSPEYTPWELSTDRANATRRKLLEHGVGLHQIFRIAGFGDTQTLKEVPPENDANRRVTVLLRMGLPDRTTNRVAAATHPAAPR